MGGAHDIREQHGREHAIEGGLVGSDGSHEPFDLVQDAVLVSDVGDVLLPGECHVLCASYVLGQVPVGLGIVFLPVQDQGGNMDRGEDVTDVGLVSIRSQATTAPGLALRRE